MKTFTAKTRSTYNYTFKKGYEKDVLSIVDLNVPGSLSVTNNIENIVKEISDTFKIDPARLVIVYKDSEGYWDGWDASKNDFIMIGSIDEDLAIKHIVYMDFETSTTKQQS